MGERRRELLVLLLGDICCLAVALYVTLTVRYLALPSEALLLMHITPFAMVGGVWLFIFYIAGLYDKHTAFLKKHLFARIINTQLANTLIAALLFFIIPFGITPKTNLVIYLVISVALLTLWRVRLFTRFSPRQRHRAILIADGEEAIELVDEVNNNKRYNYSFVRLIDKEAATKTEQFGDKLETLIQREHISIIVADPRSTYVEQIMPKLFERSFLEYQFTFLDFNQVYEETFDRVALSSLRYDWFINNVTSNQSLVYDVGKRLFDVVVSGVLLLVFALMLPFIALAIRLEGQGPIFITQERIGRQNKRVQIYKLRTMTVNDAGSGTWLGEDAKKENVVTKVGAFLRKTSIDELPQCISILKGDMSLIGPRNDIVGLGQRLASEIPYYSVRNLVKPGVTGWAQTHQYYMGDNISPQSVEESRVRLAYDLYYVKNRSMFLDIEIALRTIKTLLSRFGIVIKLLR